MGAKKQNQAARGEQTRKLTWVRTWTYKRADGNDRTGDHRTAEGANERQLE